MKKIPCLFERDFSDKRRPVLLQKVTAGCEWVLAGEGTPTRKRDGTACRVHQGSLFKRYDAKKGKTPPIGFVPCGLPDPVTGHDPGWLSVGDGPEDKWHREAWTGLRASDGSRFRPQAELADGTYELCGPRINGNPERLEEHVFLRHGAEITACLCRPETLPEDPERAKLYRLLTWEGLRDLLADFPWEGIVWHHPDGRMCKLRRDDFGLLWPMPPQEVAEREGTP